MKKYFRSQDITNSGRTVFGYAIVFDKESIDLGGFQEIIRKSAVSEDLINKSDIYLNWNHNNDYVLARSKYGKGNLELRIDNHGLFFQAELPDTAKGNEILSYIQRGELDECSFCFSLDYNDKSSEKWTYRNDNTQLREILKIKQLYDVALCFKGAYSDTECSLRDLEHCKEEINKLNNSRNMAPEEQQEFDNNLKEIEALKAEIKQLKEEQLHKDLEELDKKVEETKSENTEKLDEKEEKPVENQEFSDEKQDENQDSEEQETAKEEQETAKTDENQDENTENLPESDDKEDEKDDSEDNKDENDKDKRNIQINNKNNYHINMKKENFLIKEIRNAIETGNRTFSFPAVNEVRTVTVNDQAGDPVVAGVHDNIVDTEIQGILEPLYADGILFNLGCRMYKGLPMGDISIPKMSKTSVGWASEIAAATATGVTFENVVLSPKRITGYIDISKMLLAQDTHNAEDAIRRDIVNALNSKLQQTFFGDEAKTDDKPAGLFNGQTLEEVEDFAGIANLEAAVDDENVKGERKYVGSNKAKAAFRVMPKSALTNELLMNSGEIDGTPFIATSDIADKKFVYGDFSSIAIGSWGNVELTVDPYTTAINGCVRLIINSYWDWTVVRPEGLKFGKIKE